MSLFAIWLDRKQAKVFRLSTDRIAEEDLIVRPSFDQLAQRLGAAQKILILGPCMAKFHLINFLSEQYPLLSKKVMGCENLDKPEQQAILGQIHRYSGKT